MLQRLVLPFLILASGIAVAQDYDADQLAEIERRKQFQADFEAIVDDLNDQSFLRFTRAIDADDMRQKIIGLRMIDRRIQNSIRENFEDNLPNMVKTVFSDSKDNVVATLLDFQSNGPDGRAVVRYDLPSFQFNYIEYQLRYDDDRQRVIIVDWIDYLYGQQFTESFGEGLVAAAPSKAAVRKLTSTRLTDAEIFQLSELLKAARDKQTDRFVQIFESMSDRVKKERVVVRLHAQFMRQMRKRRNLRVALVEMAKYFPDEALFSLPLLDFYFPSRQYGKAIESLQRLESRLRVTDSAMKARLSAASLAAGNTADALAYAEQALSMQSDLELGWWSLLRVHVANKNNEGAIEALTKLEDDFGHTLNRDAFKRDRSFAAFVASSEFQAWSAERHTEGGE